MVLRILGCQENVYVWPQGIVRALTAEGTCNHLGGPPPGSSSVCWATLMEFSRSQVREQTKQVDERIVVIGSGEGSFSSQESSSSVLHCPGQAEEKLRAGQSIGRDYPNPHMLMTVKLCKAHIYTFLYCFNMYLTHNFFQF